MKKKSNDEYKQELKEKRNDEYEVLENYTASNTKILVRHKKCGYTRRVNPSSLLRGDSSCPKCSNHLLSFEEIQTILNNKNISLLSKKEEYKTMNSRLLFKCKICGYEWKTKLSNIIYNDTGCVNCKNKNKRKTPEQFKLEFDKVNNENFHNEYELLSDYVNASTKIKIRHKPCGTISEKLPFDFLSGKGCSYCNGGVCLETDNIKNKIEALTNNEYSLIGEYKNNKSYIYVKHNKCGHTFYVKPTNFFSNNSRCPYCHQSKMQQDILDFIKSLNFQVIENDRKEISPLEIDIYIPEKRIGIEINGLYWHSENFVDSDYHKEKMEAANKKNIRLIQIFEDEYYEHKDIVLNKIKHILGKDTSEKVYGRKCIVKEISSKEKNDFLNKYHIQGADNSSIYLGLFYKEKLVSVMTFSTSRMGIGKRKKSNKIFELVRYVTNSNYIVIGGFGKLLKYFEQKYHPEEIYSYADLRWCDIQNNIYIKNNFLLDHINKPNYWYCSGKKRFHRTAFMKCNLKEKFPELYDEKLTEKQIMEKTAFFRVYDCGTAVFVKKY